MYHLKGGFPSVSAGVRAEVEANGPHKPKPKHMFSHADPSATHGVRSGS